jgi:hypothetical protein
VPPPPPVHPAKAIIAAAITPSAGTFRIRYNSFEDRKHA